ncbi:MAG: hypothetical protein P4L79_14260 [Legionella sp.]|uniref:hypothetical protein n=1 Tax=Legionella sp. TaxID=459 RepID=UPI00284C35A2|nr:hypothetical protein [Legionella sp.]
MKRKQDYLEPSNSINKRPKFMEESSDARHSFFSSTPVIPSHQEENNVVITEEKQNNYPGEKNYSYQDLEGYILTEDDVKKYSQSKVTSVHLDYDGCIGIRYNRTTQTNQALIDDLIKKAAGTKLLLLFVSSARQTSNLDMLNGVRNKNGSVFHYLPDFAKRIKSSVNCPPDLEVKIVPLSLYDLIMKLPVGTTYEEILRCYDGSYDKGQVAACNALRRVPNYESKFPIIYMQLSFVSTLFKEAQSYFFDDSDEVLKKLLNSFQTAPWGMFANICYHQQQCIRGQLQPNARWIINPGKIQTNLDPYKIFQVLRTLISGQAIDGTSMGYPWLLPLGNKILQQATTEQDYFMRIYTFLKLIAHKPLEKYFIRDDQTVIAFNDPKSPNSLLNIIPIPDYDTDTTVEDDSETDEYDALQALLELEAVDRRGLNI